MTLADVLSRWQARRTEWATLGVSVDGAKLAAEVVHDLEAVAAARDEELLTPRQAALRSGYHAESIGRLIRSGQLANHGTKRRPLVKASQVPKKTPARRTSPLAKRSSMGASSRPSTADAIARDAIAGRIGR